jgi:hypothetical protein
LVSVEAEVVDEPQATAKKERELSDMATARVRPFPGWPLLSILLILLMPVHGVKIVVLFS